MYWSTGVSRNVVSIFKSFQSTNVLVDAVDKEDYMYDHILINAIGCARPTVEELQRYLNNIGVRLQQRSWSSPTRRA